MHLPCPCIVLNLLLVLIVPLHAQVTPSTTRTARLTSTTSSASSTSRRSSSTRTTSTSSTGLTGSSSRQSTWTLRSSSIPVANSSKGSTSTSSSDTLRATSSQNATTTQSSHRITMSPISTSTSSNRTRIYTNSVSENAVINASSIDIPHSTITRAPDGANDGDVWQPTATEHSSSVRDDLGRIDIVQNVAFSNITLAGADNSTSIGLNRTSPPDICDRLTEFYGQNQPDWAKYNTDAWLSNWIDEHMNAIARKGFAAAFGEWATGEPHLDCEDNGSRSNCDFLPCKIKGYNVKDSELRQVYYVMVSLKRMHDFHIGVREAITVAGITSAIAKDGAVSVFYTEVDKPDVIAMTYVLHASNVITGLLANGAGFRGPIPGNSAMAASTLWGSGQPAIMPVVSAFIDRTPLVAGNIGVALAKMYMTVITQLTTNNNALMRGQSIGATKDLRAYLSNGSFVAYPGVDKIRTTNLANQFMIAQAVNAIWRAQKIFIIGGAACGDNQGIGEGPQDRMICRDGKAWYIYHWTSVYNGIINFGPGNWLQSPTGADQLGNGIFANVTLDDVINSSLESFWAAGNNYSAAVGQERMKTMLETKLVNPLEEGVRLEGTFTIPVCDIGGSPYKSDVPQRQYILQPYGQDNRPVWCDLALCSNDENTTTAFYDAANIRDWANLKTGCSETSWKWWQPVGS